MDCNLYEHIKGRKSYLKPEKIKLYMYQLFKALDHMHSNGIFHRDIKPENILLEDMKRFDQIKVIDFGTATRFDPSKP